MRFRNELLRIVADDAWMLEILQAVRTLKLNDCWVGAGFVRNKIWDVRHGKERTGLNDIDVVYFDKQNPARLYEELQERVLKLLLPGQPWSVKNQARMHVRNKREPYHDSRDAIAHWPETATSVAVRLNEQGHLEYIAPHGLQDLFNLVVRPTPGIDPEQYRSRVQQKQWRSIWDKLDYQDLENCPPLKAVNEHIDDLSKDRRK